MSDERFARLVRSTAELHQKIDAAVTQIRAEHEAEQRVKEKLMDPVANIKEQRKLSLAILGGLGDPSTLADMADRLAELVIGLDDWRRSGGFDPYIRP